MLLHHRSCVDKVMASRLLPSYAPDPIITTQLSIPTYDGANQPIHPGVVDLGSGNAVSGYRYWMAFTPYTFSADKTENPSVVASNDGLVWVVPAGLTNPIIGPPSTGYYSDTDLVFDGTTFFMYYRYSPASGWTTYLLHTSTDGTTWTNQGEYLTSSSAPLSPTIQKVGDTYYWWAVSGGGVSRVTSSDPYDFGTDSGATSCTLTGLVGGSWHVSVVYYDSVFYMFMNTQATDGGAKIRVGASSNGTTFNFSSTPLIEVGPAGSWDSERIYQADAVIDGDGVRVWYSARGGPSNAWGIGYYEFPLSVLPSPPA